jgi:predicted transcriptional regulator
MPVMSIRIPEDKRKKLKAIASIEGKSMSNIVSDLIEEYVAEASVRLKENEDMKEIMKLSESSFSEWDNDEDEVYNDL